MRQLLALGTALTLLLAPATAAVAEQHDAPADDPATSALQTLAEAVDGWMTALLDGRAEVGADEADEEARGELEALVDSLEVTLSDLFADLYFTAVEADALAEAAGADGDAPDDEDAAGADGAAVSAVARCAPRGSFAALVEGMANHGEYVTAAAHGETVGLVVPTIEEDDGQPVVIAPVEGEQPETTEFDLSTVEGAEALCGALDVVYRARVLQLEVAWEDVDGARDARILAREQCRIERLRARDGDRDVRTVCAELRERVRDEHRAERDARRVERSEAKTDRAEAKAEHMAGRAEARADRRAEREERRDERRADKRTDRETGGRPGTTG